MKSLIVLICAALLNALSPFVVSQTLYLKTEHYPPYNIDLSREEKAGSSGIGGASTEIVAELMRRSGYRYEVELISWQRAYAAAQENVNTAVFSTTRTDAREDLFKWVGPIQENNYVLMAPADKAISITDVADLQGHTIGAYRGSAGSALLKELNIEPELVRSDHLNVLKLQRNRIDLWVTGHLYGRYLARQYQLEGLEPVFLIKRTEMYLAFHRQTPDNIIETLNKHLSVMRDEGFIEQVNARY